MICITSIPAAVFYSCFVFFVACFICLLQSTLHEWRIIFLITAVVLIMQTVIFSFMGTGKVQPWNYRQKSSLANQTMKEPQPKDTIETIRYERY